MAPPTVTVTPGDLAGAASQVESLGSAIRTMQSPTFGAVANALAGFETATAATAADAAVKQALATVSGRMEQISAALRSGGNNFEQADEIAGKHLRAMGDLNTGRR
ncbi:hypothetical protein GCM10009624_02080 [Gordonia sinesedis]